METIAVTINVPKESKEVLDALVGILSDVKAGKSVQEITAGRLGDVFKAVEGFDKLGEEAKSEGLDEIVGYAAHKIIEALRA